MAEENKDTDKVQEEAFKGTGTTEEKIEGSNNEKDLTEKDKLDYSKPGSWKKPFSTLYGDFNKWMTKQEEVMSKRYKLGYTDIAYAWYKELSPISILDRDKFKDELFSTKEIQEQYKLYLDGKAGVNGDPIVIKMQSGNILADERAFYIRHATIARSMATGLMSNGKVTFINGVYKNMIRHLRDRFDKEWEYKHTDRYKGDAEGRNSKQVKDS